jgi:broad specificity phosphatase PhoE
MRLYLVRHAESLENMLEVLAGRTPGELTENGILQTQALADQISVIQFNAIYSSPLKRALDTANILALGKDIKIQQDPRLTERDLGIYTGKSRHEVDFKQLDLDNAENKAKGVEPISMITKRTASFLDFTLDQHHDQDNILAISHSNSIRAFHMNISGVNFEQALGLNLKNGSISIFEYKISKWSLIDILNN